MGISIVAAAAVFFVVAGTLLYLIIIYNGLVRLRNDSNRAWANIDVLLKQRHDGIPNLVETVERLSAARAPDFGGGHAGPRRLDQRRQHRAESPSQFDADGCIARTVRVAENYPQLKANEKFLRLQNRISELEERIADRREFFNDDVNAYNTRIRQVPEVFLANLMALKPRELFTVSDEDRKLVEVGLTKEFGTA
jgi:LemA protein